MDGQVISHYQVHEKLGGGGMGVVYRATDTRLKRTVALKFLPPELTRDDEAKHRFMQEAEAASALDHPNICTIYEIDETGDGQSFIAMAYYDGDTLKKKVRQGPVPVGEALTIARQIAAGLVKAHRSGIVHRDIKPANIMLTSDGVVKIVDFGVAKLQYRTGITRMGSTVGTVEYMSPEQTRGEEATPASDTWALGVVLYQMLTGELPFSGAHPAVVMGAIQGQDPAPVASHRGDVPPGLERIVTRALEKEPAARYAAAEDVERDLAQCEEELRTPVLGAAAGAGGGAALGSALRRPMVAVPLTAVLLLLVAAGWGAWSDAADARRARNELVPQVLEFAETDDYAQALALAEEAERYAPDDPILVSTWPSISRLVSMESTPSGADVFVRPYAGSDDAWTHLGTTPLVDARVPRGDLRVRIELDGYETVVWVELPAAIELSPAGSWAEGMIQVPARRLHTRLNGLNALTRADAPAYQLDRYEVTNQEFMEFALADGYARPELWQHEFRRDGRTISFEEAMAEFRDATGRPGPSTWRGGRYPDGQADYPVTGVSWYEAAAYAEFAGKSLPSVAHWVSAARPDMATAIVAQSNLGEGLAPVGSHQGMSAYGTFDMAGNAAEWVHNETGPDRERYLLGGSWDDISYKFFQIDSRTPWDRSAQNGFRCALYDDEAAVASFMEPIEPLTRNYAEETPVSDEIFEVYRSQYAYDPTDLDPVVETLDGVSENWTLERITITTGYGDERMPMHLFLPRGVEPPYQAVLFHPGSGSLNYPSVPGYPLYLFEHLVLSGRAVLFPSYDGLFERESGRTLTFPDESQDFRDWMIRMMQDAGRAVDYLQTRPDIDGEKLGYLGFSWGGRRGSIVLALNPELKAAIFHSGGLLKARQRPEVDPFNFAPRVQSAVLMLNGSDDLIFPLDESQKVLFDLLGTPPDRKRHVVFDANHTIVGTHQNQLVRETLDWLDLQLGPVG
jgi:dienelactone hydrolase/predicted Ser/Thr protein kinase